jgi:hypothetical protein
LARSSTPGRRRPGAARASAPRAAGSTTAPGGTASLDDATRPRIWQDFDLHPLADATQARPLFDFAAMPWPDPAGVAFGWGGAATTGGALVAAVLAERAGRAVMLHGPLVTLDGSAPSDPLQLASQLVAAALDHAAALGADTAFARPQGLDRVWIRFGFIPVPESALPAAFAGRAGAGLYGWRGGSALWTLRDPGGESAA